MCLHMHEPMQENTDDNNQENPGQETPEQEPIEANDPAVESTEKEEIDPWEALELEAAKWKDQAIRTAAAGDGGQISAGERGQFRGDALGK
mgnify:CR=1 FL=1